MSLSCPWATGKLENCFALAIFLKIGVCLLQKWALILKKDFINADLHLHKVSFYCSILRNFKRTLKRDGNGLSQTVRICSRRFILLLHVSIADICCWVGSFVDCLQPLQNWKGCWQILFVGNHAERNQQPISCHGTHVQSAACGTDSLNFPFHPGHGVCARTHVRAVVKVLSLWLLATAESSRWHRTELVWMNVWTAIFM